MLLRGEMSGQEAYEKEVEEFPLYWNGRPRKKWDQLSKEVMVAWALVGKPRERPPFCLRADGYKT